MNFTKASVICVTVFSLVLVFMLGPTLAIAKKTPTVCDDLSGKAYGLCNAYCEALDCIISRLNHDQVIFKQSNEHYIFKLFKIINNSYLLPSMI